MLLDNYNQASEERWNKLSESEKLVIRLYVDCLKNGTDGSNLLHQVNEIHKKYKDFSVYDCPISF